MGDGESKGMGNRAVWVFGLVLLLSIVGVYAAPVKVLYADGCGWVDGTPLTCTNTKYIACNVSDTNGGGVVVNSVSFVVNGRSYSASLYSGNTTNGVWRVPVSLTYGDSDMTINSVTLRNSIGWTCSFSPSLTNPLYQGSPGDPYSCFISFQGRGEIPQSCTGTPTVCSSYTNQTQCNTAGCNWTITTQYATAPSTQTTNSGGWSSPGFVNVQDQSYASGSSGAVEDWWGFNGTLPVTAVITGVSINAVARTSNTRSGTHRITFQIGNGTSFGNSVNMGLGSGWSTQSFGSSSDLWGLTFKNPADVRVRASSYSSRGYVQHLDYLTVTVHYSIPAFCGGTPSACSTHTNMNLTCMAVGCTFNPPQGSTIRVDGWCPCEQQVVGPVKVTGQPNTCRTTLTYSPGCVGSTSSSTTTYCNWCDPEWEVSYGLCQTDRSSATPFQGLATKKYTAVNTLCCDETGLDEDCNPPADADTKVVCVQDYYVTGGGDAGTTSHAQQSSSLNSPDVFSATTYARPVSSYAGVLKPAVFDVEGDGTTELILFEEIGDQARLKIYKDEELSSPWEIYVPFAGDESGVQFAGQPSLAGFSVWGNRYWWNDDVKAKTVGIGFASVVKNLDTVQYSFMGWRRENASFRLKTETLLADSPGAGVNCFVDECYFMQGDGKLTRMNALGVSGTYGSYSSTRQVGNSSGATATDSVPAFLAFNDTTNPTAVVVEGALGSSAAVFVCPMNLSESRTCDSYVVSGVPIGRVSRIVYAGADSGVGRIYFTTADGTSSKLWSLNVEDQSGGPRFTGSNAATLSAIGGYSNCVSDPALASCYGGSKGVALASHWIYPSGNSTGYNEYSCFTGGTVKSTSWIEREEYCPKNVATQEMSWDASSSIVSPSGIFAYNQRIASIAGATNGSSVIVADLGGSTYTGITTVSETTVRNIVSRIPIYQITTTSTLTVGSASCAFDNSSKNVVITAFGVTGPKKEWIVFEGSYTSDQGTSYSDVASNSPVRRMPVDKSGQYTLKVVARDTSSGAVAEKTCVVEAVVPEKPVMPSVCTLGESNVDGDFNYDNEVTLHGWILGAVTKAKMTDSKYVQFVQAQGYQGLMFHPMACEDQRVRVEAKVRAALDSSVPGESKIQLLSRSSLYEDSTIVPVGSISVLRSATSPYVTVVLQGFSNNTLLYQQNGTTVNWLIIGFEVDRLTNQVVAQVTEELANGTQVTGTAYSTSVMNYASGEFAGVSLYGSNAFMIDYVRITNQSGIIIKSQTASVQAKQEAANLYLRNCSGVGQADNYQAPSVANNHSSNLNFLNVKKYCDRISNTVEHQSNPGYCTFEDLQEVVQVNPTCYMEAYAYCVNTTYLKTAGFQDAGLADLANVGDYKFTLEVESTGGDGAGLCAAALGISVVTATQALPLMNVLWTIMVDYWFFLLVFFIIVIIAGGMGGSDQ